MTSHALLADRLTRWITFSSRILLFGWLCACAPEETVDATALRFAVYSDADLTRIEAWVLDHDERTVDGKMLSVPFTTELRTASRAEPLFSLTVELTDQSVIRDEAIVRFDGYSENKLVLSQTVHVDFKPRDTRLVRIWLARTCANELAPSCQQGTSCDVNSGQCVRGPELVSEAFDDSVAAKGAWSPPGYTECGPSDFKCPARNCVHAQDPDCPLELGAGECASDAQCLSGNCERACYGEGCALMRCCRTACTGACEYCDEQGVCQPFANSDQVANCGACGNACPAGPHGAAACRAGQCGLSCEPGFEDCMSGVAGCETDIRVDAQHCGSCAGPDASCRYRQCRGGKCLGDVSPTAKSSTSTQFPGLYLRRLAMDVDQVLAVGVNVAEAGGEVRLFLLADRETKPGEILAFADRPVVSAPVGDAKGVLHGTEYIFDMPVSPPGAAFWVGVEPRGAGALMAIDAGAMAMEALASPTTEPMLGASFAPEEITVLSGDLGASPYVYAVVF